MQQALLTELSIKYMIDDQPDLSYLDQFENSTDPKEQEYYLRDQRRKACYQDSWELIGIKAEAVIMIPIAGHKDNYKIQTIDSGGLWGIENDSDASYINETIRGQLSELKHYLDVLHVHTDGGITVFAGSDNQLTTMSFDQIVENTINI